MYTDGKEYANMNLALIMELGVTSYTQTMVKSFGGVDVLCYEFKYSKGDKIHPTNEYPVDNQIAYNFVNHHVLLGKIIPYYTYDDMETIFDSFPRTSNIDVPEYGYLNHYSEMILRTSVDKQVPGRLGDIKKFTVIPFSSVIYNVSSNMGKNKGKYLEIGMMRATTTTSDHITPLEEISRA